MFTYACYCYYQYTTSSSEVFFLHLSFFTWVVIFLCFLVLVVGIFDDMNLSIVLPSGLMILTYVITPMIYVLVVVQLELVRDFLWHLI